MTQMIVDQDSGLHYIKGKFLGKGGFAECYEIINCKTNETVAAKIISKHLLMKDDLKEKISQEIAIHKTLDHKNIVKFRYYFEDDENIYILLELCENKSLVELQKEKKRITESQCRIIMRQIVDAVKYLHKNGIIHRDLKLSNVLLGENYEVKVSDFGLATLVDLVGDKKRAICGTPNYISPEMLSKKGHSYEVDAWSLGCIMYTLLVGSPPFETSSIEQTYSRIARNAYCLPTGLSSSAKNLITNLLNPDPSKRIKIKNIEKHEFFTNGIIVLCIFSALTTKLDNIDVNGNSIGVTDVLNLNKDWRLFDRYFKKLSSIESDLHSALTSSSSSSQLSSLTQLSSSSLRASFSPDVYCVDKWVDFTEKYGLSYELNNSVGLLFNDDTRLIFLKQTRTLVYMVDGKDGQTTTRTICNFVPNDLKKKFFILHYFMQYMRKHLSTAGLSNKSVEKKEMKSSSLVFVITWYRCESSIIFLLSNNSFQINFFSDHSKLIIDGKSWCYLLFHGQTKEIEISKLSSNKLDCQSDSSNFLAHKITYCKVLISKICSLDNY
ncbi:hypothetical protein HELRODRAFT_64399 [Helobdella robusta]|uniref:Serine/threonine-protein kinase PLK n=1 Tax=Helobdella robusta TaxID=6412 RepID=T1FXU3_HELRO|nr:hypothetical protein HELRODRAFT_64399 [Helobdella robusta]ESO06257.1 hypothetical protein HELRODRAFT_64399 [Helobdella robusta]